MQIKTQKISHERRFCIWTSFLISMLAIDRTSTWPSYISRHPIDTIRYSINVDTAFPSWQLSRQLFLRFLSALFPRGILETSRVVTVAHSENVSVAIRANNRSRGQRMANIWSSLHDSKGRMFPTLTFGERTGGGTPRAESKEQRGIKGKFRNTTGNTGWNICLAQTENSRVTFRPFSLVLSAGRFREHSRGSKTPGLPWNHCSRWRSFVFSLLRTWTGAQCTSFFLLTVPVSLLSAPGLLFPLARLHSGSPFLRQKSQSYWWKRVAGAKDVFLRVDGIVDGIDVARL